MGVDGIQDAFIGSEVVLHLDPDGKYDAEAVAEVLKKHKVKVLKDPKVAPEKVWKKPVTTTS